ncbi:MAG: methylated-DNA--[protein]-cysteine S-methyltransferase [Alphaproteobacteria bacterium]
MTRSLTMPSPHGTLLLESDGAAITALRWGTSLPKTLPTTETDPILSAARDRLADYFNGDLVEFDLNVRYTVGTPFQQRVWNLMRAIPYGATRCYGDLARDLGSAARAIGMACGANPIPILVPCHRIVAANGGLGGFSGHHGVATKRRLLILEGALLPL